MAELLTGLTVAVKVTYSRTLDGFGEEVSRVIVPDEGGRSIT